MAVSVLFFFYFFFGGFNWGNKSLFNTITQNESINNIPRGKIMGNHCGPNERVSVFSRHRELIDCVH